MTIPGSVAIIDTTGRPAIELSAPRSSSHGGGSGVASAPQLLALAAPAEPMPLTSIPAAATEWRTNQRAYVDLTAWTDASAVFVVQDGASGVTGRIEWSPTDEIDWQPLGGLDGAGNEVHADVSLAAAGVQVGESVTLSRDTMQPVLLRWATAGGTGAETVSVGNVYLYCRSGAVARVGPGACNSELASVIRAGGAFYGDDFCWATTTPEFRAGILVDHRYQSPTHYTVRGGVGSQVVQTDWNGGHRGLRASGGYPDSWRQDDLATAFTGSRGVTARLRFTMAPGWSSGAGGAFDLVRVDADQVRGDFRWAVGVADVASVQRFVLRYQAANGPLSWTVIDLAPVSAIATGVAVEVLIMVECIDTPADGHQHVIVQAGPALGALATYYDEVQVHEQSDQTALPVMAAVRWFDSADMASGLASNTEFTVLEWEVVRPCDAQLSGLAINADLQQDLCGISSPGDLREQLAPGDVYQSGKPYRSADTRAFRLSVDPGAWNGKQSLVATGNTAPRNALSLLVPIATTDIWVRAIIRDIRGGVVVAHANTDGRWVLGKIDSEGAPGAPTVTTQSPGADGCTQIVGGAPLVPDGIMGDGEQWEYGVHAVLDVVAGHTSFTIVARRADRSSATYITTIQVAHASAADLARDWRVVFFPTSVAGEELGAWEVVDGSAHANPFDF